MSAESFISPTLKHVYDKDSDWPRNEDVRYRRGFISAKSDVDYDGYDVQGFNEMGFDRAGFRRTDYEADPKLATIVAACGPEIVAGRRNGRTFGQLMETTRIVMDELSAAFPGTPVYDADEVDDAPAEALGRDAVAGGNLSVFYRRGPNWVAFTTDEISEIFEGDGGAGHGLRAYASDISGSIETRRFARDEEGLRAFVQEVLADFNPALRKYAVFVTDTPDGPAFEAAAYDGHSQDEEEANIPAYDGDHVSDVLAPTVEAALSDFAAARTKTLAVAEMVERGLWFMSRRADEAPGQEAGL